MFCDELLIAESKELFHPLSRFNSKSDLGLGLKGLAVKVLLVL
tara:strand:- start:6485 stop:6613 length:129 start_codon:yes stop_codon:yes gene_type:complete